MLLLSVVRDSGMSSNTFSVLMSGFMIKVSITGD